jgi:SAM-dependent methyltransferase
MPQRRRVGNTETGGYYRGDTVGTILRNWRIRSVLPHVRGTLIDMACGDNWLVRSYGSGTGIDIAAYTEGVMQVSDFSTLPLPANCADTVTIVAALNYLNDPDRVLLEVQRILRSDGRLIITMPSLRVMRLWHRVREPWAREPGFSDETLRRMLRQARFQVEERVRFMCFLNNIYIARKASRIQEARALNS